MNYDLVIKNGTVVTASSTFQADVAVRGEKIAAIGENLSGAREIDATGKLVTPGAVDIHVHMQMPLPNGVVSADTFHSGTVAAAHGGTTTIVDFVSTEADQKMVDALKLRMAEADHQVVIDYGLHMTIGPNDIDDLGQLSDIYDLGIGSYKLYMAYGFRLTDDQLYKALTAVRNVGGLPVIHAENWDVITALVDEAVSAEKTATKYHQITRPSLLEGEAVGRVIDIATHVGLPIHIFHVSCEAAVNRIKEARARLLPVSAETCPQYLFLTSDIYERDGIEATYGVCAPPIRPQADQDALWLALANGDLQMVTTDHCPFVSADKALGLDDFSNIPGGVPSIEMRFAAIHSKGVRSGLISLNQWVDLCCTRPARMLELRGKGNIAVGYDADLVIFDQHCNWVVSAETLHENVDYTPYENLKIQGKPLITISRGEIIIENGKCLAQAGQGRFVPTTHLSA